MLLAACQNNYEGKEIQKILKPSQKIGDTLYFSFNNNHIILNSIIEGRIKARLIYDTGAGGNLYFDSAFTVKSNWFKPSSEHVQDTLKKMSWGEYANQKYLFSKRKLLFQLGGIRDTLPYTVITNLFKVIKGKADGIIGNNFMSKYVVEINYEKNYIVLHDPPKFRPTSEYSIIPIVFGTKTKLATLELTFYLANGKQFTRTCLFDSGVGKNEIALANNKIIEQFDLFNQLQNGVTEIKDFTTMHTNYRETSVGQLKSVRIGNNLFIDTPKVRLLFDKSLGQEYANLNTLVGNYIFKKFGRIVIDYQNDKIYIPKEIAK